MTILLVDLHSVEKEALNNHGIYSVLLVLFIIAAPGLVYYSLLIWRTKKWENQVLPKNSGDSDRSFAMAYLCLSVLLMKNDSRESKLKQSRLNHALSQFSYNLLDLQAEFETLLKKEIRVKHVAEWINLHLDHTEKEELFYLLIEIALIDGTIISGEYQILNDLADYCDISPKELRSMIASHMQHMAREEAKARQRRREQRREAIRRPTKSAKELAFEILGVSPHAAMDEIKKAYRNLVKKHHPDRFAGESETIIKAAEARFIEIQKAYEIVSA